MLGRRSVLARSGGFRGLGLHRRTWRFFQRVSGNSLFGDGFLFFRGHGELWEWRKLRLQGFNATRTYASVRRFFEGRHPAPAAWATDMAEFAARADADGDGAGSGSDCDMGNDKKFGQKLAVFPEQAKRVVVGQERERDRCVERFAELAAGPEWLDGLVDLGAHTKKRGKLGLDDGICPRGGSGSMASLTWVRTRRSVEN